VAFLSSNGRPIKPDVYVSSLGYRPIAVPHPVGMSDKDYRDYAQRVQGEEARRVANLRGVDTSGMKWDGEKFVDANEVHRYADPGFWGPVAVTAASLGTGLLPNAATQAPTTASTLAGPGTSAITNSPSLAVPTATQAALNPVANFTSSIVGNLPGAGLTGAQMAALTASAGVPTVATLLNASQADPANNQPPRTQANGNAADPFSNQPPGTVTPPNNNNPNTNSFNLPWGLTGKDLIGYTGNFVNNWLNRNAAGEYNEARAAADKAALDFAMRAYDEQQQKEQARWDATEQRRVPYRAASVRTLEEFRRLLGIEN